MNQVTNDFADWLLTERSASESTISAYDCDVSQFLGYLSQAGVQDLRLVTAGTVTDFFAQFGAIANATKLRKFAALRTFFLFARERRLVDGDPTEGARPAGLHLRDVEPPQLTMAQVASIMAQVPEGTRDHAVIAVLSMGLTASEVCRLTVNDVDLTAGTLTVAATGHRGQVYDGESYEGGGGRVVMLTEDVIQAMSSYLRLVRPTWKRRPNEQTLFLNYAGRPVSRQSVWSALTTAAKKAGIEAVNPRVLRTARAIDLLDRGADVHVVQKQLGHADISTTMRYLAMARRRRPEVAHAG